MKKKFESNKMMEKDIILAAIHNRKSVRDYLPQKPVSKEDLHTMIKAGMAAPSAKNKQPWAFIAITDNFNE